MFMNREQQEEYDNLKAKAEALFQAHGRAADAARMVGVCIDPGTNCGDDLASSRETLTKRCRELIEATESLATHGKSFK